MIGVLFYILSFFQSDSSDIHHIDQELAQSVIDQKLNEQAIQKLANLDSEFLTKALNSDAKKKAFWINVYNGLIYAQLSQNRDLYNDRDAFFNNKSLIVAGIALSFDDIEHDILRKSTWKYSFGYFPNFFSGDFESENEVNSLDPRIHFALNCGAESCPPVRVYHFKDIHQQLDYSAKSFLSNTSDYKKSENSVSVSPLFNWFRGDFGGKNGIHEMLEKYDVIPLSSKPEIEYQEYNWQINLSNTGSF
ncbi:MAG: DUF547 domain-containing protein [Cyclobacteriaceae bacterium]